MATLGRRIVRPRSGPAPTSAARAWRVEADAFVHAQQLALGAGQQGFGLLDAAAGFQPARKTFGEQLRAVPTHGQRRFISVPHCIQPGQVGVAGGDGARQRQPGLGRVGAAGFQVGGRGGQTRAVAAPEVDFPTEIEGGAADLIPVARAALALAGSGGVGAHLRKQGGTRHGPGSFGPAQAGGGSGHVRRVAQCFSNQGIELGIAIGLPPMIIGPRDGRCRKAGRAVQPFRCLRGGPLAGLGELSAGACHQGQRQDDTRAQPAKRVCRKGRIKIHGTPCDRVWKPNWPHGTHLTL